MYPTKRHLSHNTYDMKLFPEILPFPLRMKPPKIYLTSNLLIPLLATNSLKVYVGNPSINLGN